MTTEVGLFPRVVQNDKFHGWIKRQRDTSEREAPNNTIYRKRYPRTMNKHPTQSPEDSLASSLRFVPKPLYSIYSRLFSRKFEAFERRHVLDPQIFAGKHVLIAGPARTIDEDLNDLGVKSKSYDFIVKMNNGLSTPIQALGQDAWRCDVLFHNFKDDTRDVAVDDLHRAGVKHIVYRSASRVFYPELEQTIEEYGALQPPVSVHLIPSKDYKSLRPQLGGYRPTSGLVSIRYFLDAPVASLTIAGFTFFTTRYVAGYNDTVASDTQSLERVRRHNRHEPRREAGLLQTWLEQISQSGKKVILGKNVCIAMRVISSVERA